MENFRHEVLLFEFLISVDKYLEVILVTKKVVFTFLVIHFLYLVILNELRDYKVVELIQCWFKRISCSVRVEHGLYVKTLVIDSNQRMTGSNPQKFVNVATIIDIEGFYLNPKRYPVGRAPD